MTDTAKTTQIASVLERAICLVLRASYLGNSRKFDLKTVGLTKDGADHGLSSAALRRRE